MLSLVCVCYLNQHTVRRERCFLNPVPTKVFGDTSMKTDMST